MLTWTPEERLLVIAAMLAYDRREAMQNRAVPYNHETMLIIAAAPDSVLRESGIETRLGEWVAPVNLEGPVNSEIVEHHNRRWFAEIVEDIKRLFPDPAQRPPWAQ